MSARVTITCTCAKAGTLNVLNRLIGERERVLQESARDAVIATAINVLTSLRSATRSAKSRRKYKIQVEAVPGVRPGFTGGRRAPRRCLRTETGDRYESDLKVRFTNNGRSLKSKLLKVYRVIPEHESVKPYLCVAESVKDAHHYEAMRTLRRIENYGLLARSALGVAMRAISTRNVKDDASPLAEQKASTLASVQTFGGDNSPNFTAVVNDNLDYAVAALRRGRGDVDLAFRKAANRTAGILTSHLHRLGDFSNDIASPFPNIRRRRK